MVSSEVDKNRITVRVFSNYELGEAEQSRYLTCSSPGCAQYDFRFNKSGRAHLALVLNFPKLPSWVSVPQGRVVKILQEPIVWNYLTHRFTFKHSALYDSVRTHNLLGSEDARLIWDHPHLPMHVARNDRREDKKYLISVIASRLSVLPGHKKRDSAVTSLLAGHPELNDHAFGRGRKEIADKAEGLSKYRYSIAIENDSSEHYFTEKILDCFESLTVPIYFGAPDIDTFFPPDSFIRLQNLDIESLERAMLSCSTEDYEARLPALIEARELARKYSRLCCLASEVLNEMPQANGLFKPVLLVPLDTVITFIWRAFISGLRALRLYRPALAAANKIRSLGL